MKQTSLIITLFALLVFKINGQPINDCSICSKQLLNADQLKNKSLEELVLLRNEIYARNGYVFNNYSFGYYFENQKWYQPASSNDEIQLSDIEQKNVALLKSLENKIQNRRNIAISDLKRLKTALNENDKQIINEFVGNIMIITEDYWAIEYLKKAMNHINLDDIHWNKNKGFYSVSIDNGFGIFKCEIIFKNDYLMIEVRNYGFSEIFEGFEYTPQSPFMITNEFFMWWKFAITDKGIVLKDVNGAG